MNGISGLRLTRPRAGQRGASAVEFVFVFPILFAIAYGGVVYAYMYVLQQSINFAAQQGAQAAVATVPINSGASSAADTGKAQLANATKAINDTLGWLGTAQLLTRLTIPQPTTNCNVAGSTFAVQVNFTTAGLFATFTLPLVGSFPAMPSSLFACAVAFT